MTCKKTMRPRASIRLALCYTLLGALGGFSSRALLIFLPSFRGIVVALKQVSSFERSSVEDHHRGVSWLSKGSVEQWQSSVEDHYGGCLGHQSSMDHHGGYLDSQSSMEDHGGVSWLSELDGRPKALTSSPCCAFAEALLRVRCPGRARSGS